MDIVLTIFSVFFIGALLVAALTFGFAILTFFMAIAFVTALLIAGRELLRRWHFIKSAEYQSRTELHVIEGEYKDITHKNKQEEL